MLWLCVKLWSKMAATDETSEGYTSNADELLVIAKSGEDGLKVRVASLRIFTMHVLRAGNK